MEIELSELATDKSKSSSPSKSLQKTDEGPTPTP
jgi:hypothetical protein